MNDLTKPMHTLCIFFGIALFSHAYAQFVPDFLSDNGGVPATNTTVTHGDFPIRDQTPYLEEIVFDPNTGKDYVHILIGNPADGFAQDFYIERGFVNFPNGNVGSASAGGSLRGEDIFGTSNGTNTGNPNRTIVRQILNDGEISQEFLQTQLTTKPKISQMLNAPDITTLYVIDMSNSTYSDDTTAGTITGSVTLSDPYIDPGIGDFTMSSDGVTTATVGGGRAAQDQSSQITAGRYTYTQGNSAGGSDGTYNYAFDEYDPFAIDTAVFFDSSEDNPWSYDELRPE